MQYIQARHLQPGTAIVRDKDTSVLVVDVQIPEGADYVEAHLSSEMVNGEVFWPVLKIKKDRSILIYR